MTLEEIASLPAAERARARRDLHEIWKWCSGGHHEGQLQQEYRARRAKTKKDPERDRDFAAAVEALGIQAFMLMQAIDSGCELIFSYGQIVARAARLGFWSWEDKLCAGVRSGGFAGRDPVPEPEKKDWRLRATEIWRNEPKAKLTDVADRIVTVCSKGWGESHPWKATTVQAAIGDLSPRSPKKKKDQ